MDNWIIGLMKIEAKPMRMRMRMPFIQRSTNPSTHLPARRGGRVVYCGGLENRFGFTADGGSNPSLSAIVEL
jgi:hypothetical protein